MDLPEWLWRFVADPDDVPLEDALLAVAACRPDSDVDTPAAIERLDALADDVPDASVAAVCASLFGPAGFRGDAVDYHDPRNSFLDVGSSGASVCRSRCRSW